MTADKVRRNVITLSDFHVEIEKFGEYCATISVFMHDRIRGKMESPKKYLTAYKTSLLFYLIEILDGRYPENNICFFHIHSCVWSGRDCLNYKPERMPGPIGSHRSVSTRIARLVYVCIHAVPQRTGRW
jgi:hypothetical protein